MKTRNRLVDFLIFSGILLLFYFFVYKNLLSLGMMIFGDLAPFYLKPEEGVTAYVSSWSDTYFGYSSSNPPGTYVFHGILQFLLGGNYTWAQRVFHYSIAPISSLAMFIFLSHYTDSRFTRFVCGFIYSVNPLAISLFLTGGPGGGMLIEYALFPLQLLFLFGILNERGNQKINILSLALFLAAAAAYNLQAILWFAPFLATFVVTHLITQRDLRYMLKTVLSLFASGLLLVLLLLPEQNLVVSLINFFFNPESGFLYNSSIPMSRELLIERVVSDYQTQTFDTLNIFIWLTILSTFFTIFVRRRRKYMVSSLLLIVLLLLFWQQSKAGTIFWLYEIVPPLYALNTLKLKMMLTMAFAILVALLIDEASARGFLDLRINQNQEYLGFLKPNRAAVSFVIVAILVIPSFTYNIWPEENGFQYMTGNLDLSKYVIPDVYYDVRSWMDTHSQSEESFRIFWLPLDPSIEQILRRFFINTPLFYPQYEWNKYYQSFYGRAHFYDYITNIQIGMYGQEGLGRLLGSANVKYLVVNLAANKGGGIWKQEGSPKLSPWGTSSISWYWTGNPEEYARLLDLEKRLRVVERNEDFIIYENLDFIPFIKAYDRVFFVAPKDMINQTQKSQMRLSNHDPSTPANPNWNAIIGPGRVGKLFRGATGGVITSIHFYMHETNGVNSTLSVFLSPDVSTNYVASYKLAVPANQPPNWLRVPVNLKWPYDKLFVYWFASNASAQWGFDGGMPYDDYYCANVSNCNWVTWDDRPWVMVNIQRKGTYDWVPSPSPISEWNYETVLASSSNHLFDQIPGFNGTNLVAITAMMPFAASDEAAKRFLSAVDGIILMGDLVETAEAAWVSEHPTLLSVYEAETTITPANRIWQQVDGGMFTNRHALLAGEDAEGFMQFFVPRDSYYRVGLRAVAPEGPSLRIDDKVVDVEIFRIGEDGFRWFEADAGLLQRGWHDLSISARGEKTILDQVILISNIEASIGLEEISSNSNSRIVEHEDSTTLHRIKMDLGKPVFVVMLNSYHTSWNAYVDGYKLEHYGIPLNMYWANLYRVNTTGMSILEVSYTLQQERNISITLWAATWLASIFSLVYFSRSWLTNFFSNIYRSIERIRAKLGGINV